MIAGTILAYSTAVNAGVIKGIDGKGYYFTKANWLSPELEPENNAEIIFTRHCGRAISVKLVAVGEIYPTTLSRPAPALYIHSRQKII
jgi:hypothetical protein